MDYPKFKLGIVYSVKTYSLQSQVYLFEIKLPYATYGAFTNYSINNILQYKTFLLAN